MITSLIQQGDNTLLAAPKPGNVKRTKLGGQGTFVFALRTLTIGGGVITFAARGDCPGAGECMYRYAPCISLSAALSK